MGKGAPLRWLENCILRRHITGQGVEIGALWRRFRVPGAARVWYVDRNGIDGLEGYYPELKGKIVPPDILADAESLPFKGGVDFIIASHVLEHLPFPLTALKSWYDALAPGGVLLLRVPDKRFTSDSTRQRTSLVHLQDEMACPESFDYRGHYADWVEHIYHTTPSQPHYESSINNLLSTQYSIHFHVWTDEDVEEMIEYTIKEWHLGWDTRLFWHAHFYRKEVVAILKKQ